MRFIKIPKKTRGEFRTICVPNKKEKAELRLFLPLLNNLCITHCNYNTTHGFMPFKSAVTNAKLHVNKAFTLTIDLKDWFDTVKKEHVECYFNNIEFPKKHNIITKLVNQDVLDLFSYGPVYNKEEFFKLAFVKDLNGMPRAAQGLPTSPQIANLAAVKMDKDIHEYLLTIDDEIIWSRYADDISCSFDKYETYEKLKKNIPIIVELHNFKVNPKKIWLQTEKFGRRITGIVVSNGKIKAPKKFRKRIRAINHHIKKAKASNIEWSRKVSELKNTVTYENDPVFKQEFRDARIKFNSSRRHIMILEKQLKSLNEWNKLKSPTPPVYHTFKVLKSYFAYLNAKYTMSNNLDPMTNNKYKNYTDELDRILDVYNKNKKTEDGYSESMKMFIKRLYAEKVLTSQELRKVNDIVEKDRYAKNLQLEIGHIRDINIPISPDKNAANVDVTLPW